MPIFRPGHRKISLSHRQKVPPVVALLSAAAGSPCDPRSPTTIESLVHTSPLKFIAIQDFTALLGPVS